MTLFLGILLTFIVFLIVVLIHELGHFMTARWTGMKVEEFGFGIPPRVFKIFRDKKGTDYTYNLLPIGGFVRIFGEDPTGTDAKKDGAFMTKKLPARLLVLVAGVMMNFLLAFVVFTGLFWYGIAPVSVMPLSDKLTNSVILPSFSEAEEMGYISHSGIILSPLTGSLAEQAGIQDGDLLISINDIVPITTEDAIRQIQSSPSIQLELSRSGSILLVNIIPKDGKVGMYIGYNEFRINKDFLIKKQGFEAIILAARETYYSSVFTLDFLWQTVKHLVVPSVPAEREQAKEMLSGPIGAGKLFVGLVEVNAPVTIILIVIALLSINLGVLNLLPFPALDGGRIVTTTLYSFFSFFPGSRDTFLQFEKYLHAIGFILLLMLMLYVAGLDIGRLSL